MSTNLNKHRPNNLIRGGERSIAQFESQGNAEIYATAQFFCSGKKQNGTERGNLNSLAKQIRTYITSEEADGARMNFINEQTGKTIYSKSFTDLRTLPTEFCATLNSQELEALHLLFVGFEKDPNNIQKALQTVTLGGTLRAAA